VEKKGLIVVITNLAAPNRNIFMDITGVVTNAPDTTFYGEEGCLGLTFHPGFATNGFFYVFYTGLTTTAAGSGRHDILSRFKVSPGDPNQGDSASEVRYIVQYDQGTDHNAGDLHFGPDGYLYVSLGDGGCCNDFLHNAQRINKDFFSAIMRLDLDNRPGSLPPNFHFSSLPSLTNYSIPPDNPFIGTTNFNASSVNPTNVRTEFWAVGMRNPWRFSFDPLTGDLYLGHVGEHMVEWINLVTNKANFGWSFYEGHYPTSIALPPPGFVLTPPILEYFHGSGRACVIGGIVYRGGLTPQLYGAYLFADYASGEIWSGRYSPAQRILTQVTVIISAGSTNHVSCFGVDPSNGDPLVAAIKGGTNSAIQRIISAVPVQFPIFTNVSLSGTNLILAGTNGSPTQAYYLLASSNLLQSVTSWPPVATGLFDSSGNFTVTNPISPGFKQHFYRIQVP
jgi:hypothetical protein